MTLVFDLSQLRHLPRFVAPVALTLCLPSALPAIPIAGLLAPACPVDVAEITVTTGVETVADGTGWIVRGSGPGPSIVVLSPEEAAWDFDAFNHLRIDLHNTGNYLVRIEGSLENDGAVSWARSLPGSAVVPAADSGTLGFSFTRPRHAYDGPEVFLTQSAKPNGHRTHWRPFDPSDVRSIRLTFFSAGAFEVSLSRPALCWSAGSAANKALEELPYLDRFGQARVPQWPGKISDVQSLAAALEKESNLDHGTSPPGLNRFGGWRDGPQLEATGNFRIKKIDGRWWFVDPDGRLFWSHGANSVGAGASTPVTAGRDGFFEWLPDSDDPLYRASIRQPRGDGALHADFLAANFARVWGDAAPVMRRDLDHRRLRAWGINTLGAWSDADMIRDRRTVYTLTTGVWSPVLHHDGGHVLPDPFDPGFEQALRRALEDLAWARGDAWCLGVFIDNELEWAKDLAPILFASPPGQPARAAFMAHLKNIHADLTALNDAWGSAFAAWEEIATLERPPGDFEHPAAFTADMDAFHAAFADRYFSTCRRLMRELLPGHLYLGCRIHRAPDPVIRAAARYVDVFSVNRYESLASAAMLPEDADLPVLITEFHFGAPDRGVPGTGLRGVHDQTQRGLAYAAYVVGGLLDPRVVGTHWFAWPDQSAAGRPGENYQIGFIDITGRAYPEFTAIVQRLSHGLYPLRHQASATVEQALEEILGPPANR